MELLFAPQNLPFTTALGLMLALGVLEMVALSVGMTGLASVGDDFFTVRDIESPEIEGSGIAKLLGWLRFGQVPVLILLVVFLTAFGIAGILLQVFSFRTLGFYFHPFLASMAAAVVAVPMVRVCGGGIAKIMPGDETSAVSAKTFIGRVAVLTIGTARKGEPAEAKLFDEHGQCHFIMVEPDDNEMQFSAGDSILIVKVENGRAAGIPAPSELLSVTSSQPR